MTEMYPQLTAAMLEMYDPPTGTKTKLENAGVDV